MTRRRAHGSPAQPRDARTLGTSAEHGPLSPAAPSSYDKKTLPQPIRWPSHGRDLVESFDLTRGRMRA